MSKNHQPRPCKPAGILIGFESEDDWFDYKLEHDPRFQGRIEAARQSIKAVGASRSKISAGFGFSRSAGYAGTAIVSEGSRLMENSVRSSFRLALSMSIPIRMP
jgi:hypothetical protein